MRTQKLPPNSGPFGGAMRPPDWEETHKKKPAKDKQKDKGKK